MFCEIPRVLFRETQVQFFFPIQIALFTGIVHKYLQKLNIFASIKIIWQPTSERGYGARHAVQPIRERLLRTPRAV